MFKTWTKASIDKNMEQLQLSYIAVSDANLYNHFRKKVWYFSYMVKHKFAIGPINSTTKYLPKRNEDMWTHTDFFIAALLIIAIN